MASRLPVALTTVWMLESPDLLDCDDTSEEFTLNFFCSWTCTVVKVRVPWLVLPMGLATSGCSPGCIVMPGLSHGMYGLLHMLLGTLEPVFLWGLILTVKPKWQWCRQMQMGMCRSPSFNASFGDGLGNQLPAFHRLNALTLSWACLPTQLMASDSINTTSHASPKLSPSLSYCLP